MANGSESDENDAERARGNVPAPESRLAGRQSDGPPTEARKEDERQAGGAEVVIYRG